MRFAIIFAAGLCAACLLSGCASLTNAGHAAYSVTPVRDGDGKIVSHELSIKDGKEFDGRQIQAVGDAVSLTIREGESKAFKGQAIGAKGLSVLPTVGLQDILK